MTIPNLFMGPIVNYYWAIPLVCLLIISSYIFKKYSDFRRLVHIDPVLLELTPPPSPHSTLQATEEFFMVLRQVVGLRTWREMLAGRKSTISLEVVSNPLQGIRYLVRLPRQDMPVFMQTLAALAPTVTANETDDYLSSS